MPHDLMLCSSLHSGWKRSGSSLNSNGVEVTGSSYPCLHIAVIDGETGNTRHGIGAGILLTADYQTAVYYWGSSLPPNYVADQEQAFKAAGDQIIDFINNHYTSEGDILAFVSDINTDWMRNHPELRGKLNAIGLPNTNSRHVPNSSHYIEVFARQKTKKGGNLFHKKVKCVDGLGSVSISARFPTISELKAEKQAQAEAERQRQIAAETARQLQQAQEQAKRAQEERERMQRALEAKTEETEAAKEAAMEAKRSRILEQLAHKEEQANSTLTQMSKAFPLIRDALSTLERFSTDGATSAKFSADIEPIEKFVTKCRSK